MPYIKKEHRRKLDPHIDTLVEQIVMQMERDSGAFVEYVEYSCMNIGCKTVELRFGGFRYWILAILTGVFQNVVDEMHRRFKTHKITYNIKSDELCKVPITEEGKNALDPCINALSHEIALQGKNNDTDFAGLLNYSCTRVALKTIRIYLKELGPDERPNKGLDPWYRAILTRIFKNIQNEIYRQIAAPYEDKQIEKNGDVDLYEEFLKDI